MGLFGSLTSSVTGLASQSEAISVISDNLSNVNTVGYKASRALFSQLVTSAGVSGVRYNSGGSGVDVQRASNEQGSLISTGSATDLALSGSGFFVVVSDRSITPSTSTFFSRAGAFVEDSRGFLQHPSGNFLLGWRTNSAGDILDRQNPEAIELQTVGSSASATSDLQIGITLDANENTYVYNTNQTLTQNFAAILSDPTRADFITDSRFYDAQGGARDISIAFMKRGTNQWDWMAFTDGDNIIGGTAGTNTEIGRGTLTFNPNGSLEAVTGNQMTVNWSGGVPAATINMDFGDQTGGFVFSDGTGNMGFDGTVDVSTNVNDASNPVIAPTAQRGRFELRYNGSVANTFTLVAPDGTTSQTIANPGPGGTLNFNTLGVSLDLDAGFVADTGTPTYAVGSATTTDINAGTFAFGSAVLAGQYTLTALAGGPPDLRLTDPTGATVDIANPGAGNVATFNFGAGQTVSFNMSAGFTLPGAGVMGTFSVYDDHGDVFNTTTGNIQALTLDQDKYAAVHGATASPVGSFAFGWNATTGQLTVTDPAGSVYSATVSSVAEPRRVEFANGVTIDLSANWVPPANSMTLGTVAAVSVNPGTNGVGTDGLLQLSSDFNTRFSIQNGFGSGTLSSVSVDEEGFIIGSFTNGQTNRLYRLVVAVFPSPGGLNAVSENLFRQTENSGLPLYREAGLGGTATVSSGALEQSTVDIANEFSQLIISQRAYQAASRVVSTVDQMLNELLNVR